MGAMCQAVFFLISETLSSPEYWGRWDCVKVAALENKGLGED
ncbi:hypothetical protein CWATWH0402_3573 [Crocosphaera watsonii WH 0402]|uniref:Uncharacterized protein n=1 Tax=Crocosphaera watsonii WH 0402 TaxID=1284629 RepID=T2JPQ4_CROWT|nr:hypothetical protein CWATWH0402_3573 [Crocosphaera watsonii WH 0402]